MYNKGLERLITVKEEENTKQTVSLINRFTAVYKLVYIPLVNQGLQIYRRQRTWKRARNTSDEHEERTKVRDEMRSPKYFDANFSSYRSIFHLYVLPTFSLT
ncbi:hypothetical protein Bandiella_00050 [Candidatus Bandiella woodruffii]|uniref:Transposase n=1 Tax=Candidatus Bandiella euplotis TaxID=1664265 RepID=A0ABZ0UIP3_9RICK|nr:hypothetical protein Bandiella_00050 [Candidatus Bandiella woodruffii]